MIKSFSLYLFPMFVWIINLCSFQWLCHYIATWELIDNISHDVLLKVHMVPPTFVPPFLPDSQKPGVLTTVTHHRVIAIIAERFHHFLQGDIRHILALDSRLITIVVVDILSISKISTLVDRSWSLCLVAPTTVSVRTVIPLRWSPLISDS